jgi:hypothetical protein
VEIYDLLDARLARLRRTLSEIEADLVVLEKQNRMNRKSLLGLVYSGNDRLPS